MRRTAAGGTTFAMIGRECAGRAEKGRHRRFPMANRKFRVVDSGPLTATGRVLVACLLLGAAPALGQPTYTVVPGDRVERSLNVPCALEFDITNKVPTDAAVEEHLAWAVTEGGDWQGGNPGPGTYTAAYRDYKLKVYSEAGYAGEQRIGVAWDPAQVYTVRAEINPDNAVYIVRQGTAIIAEESVSAIAPPRVTMGYGWPPSVRSGATGAILSQIRWEESTTTTPSGERFAAEADTFTEAEAPGVNHGAEATVQTGGNGRVIFVRFTVSGEDLPIASATINLDATNSGGGGEIHFVPDGDWSELALTHDTRPCLSPTVLDGLGRVESGSRYALDVTAAVPGNGTYSFAIRSSEPDGSAYVSTEAGGWGHPVLVVVRGERPALSPPEDCTPDPPADGGGPDDAADAATDVPADAPADTPADDATSVGWDAPDAGPPTADDGGTEPIYPSADEGDGCGCAPEPGSALWSVSLLVGVVLGSAARSPRKRRR
jgi:hypothetical protein